MDLKIRGEKIEVTSAMKEHITEKLTKLDRLFEKPEKITANVLVRIRGDKQIVEVTVPTQKFTLRAEERNKDFYAAVDLVTDILERQLRKNKEKIKGKYKNQEPIEFNFDYEDIEEQEETKIVKRKNVSMKPMDEEEAILQANLLGHDFFIFKNTDEDCVSVVYKRKEDNYGIINVK